MQMKLWLEVRKPVWRDGGNSTTRESQNIDDKKCKNCMVFFENENANKYYYKKQQQIGQVGGIAILSITWHHKDDKRCNPKTHLRMHRQPANRWDTNALPRLTDWQVFSPPESPFGPANPLNSAHSLPWLDSNHQPTGWQPGTLTHRTWFGQNALGGTSGEAWTRVAPPLL